MRARPAAERRRHASPRRPRASDSPSAPLAQAVSPDGVLVATGEGSSRARIAVWRAADGAPLHRFRGVEGGGVLGLCFASVEVLGP